MANESLEELIKKRKEAKQIAQNLVNEGFDRGHPPLEKALDDVLAHDAAIRKLQNPKGEKMDMETIKENLKTIELKMQSMKLKADLKKLKEKPKKKSLRDYFRIGGKAESTHEVKA